MGNSNNNGALTILIKIQEDKLPPGNAGRESTINVPELMVQMVGFDIPCAKPWQLQPF
jgi:hypothetical protein